MSMDIVDSGVCLYVYFLQRFYSRLFSLKERYLPRGPLSPLLFCLAEDVLSRHIIALVNSGGLIPMTANRNYVLPTHCLYADDILIF